MGSATVDGVYALNPQLMPPRQAITLGFYNDAYAVASTEDWDDLRTFGFSFGLSADRASLGIDYMELTYRGDSEYKAGTAGYTGASRSTHLRLLGQVHRRADRPLGSWLLSPALGLDVEGELGGHVLQYSLHERLEVPRDLPEDEERQALLASALVGAAIGYEHPSAWVPVIRLNALSRLVTHGDGPWYDGARGDIGLWQVFHGARARLRAHAFYTFLDPAAASTTLARVQEEERGLGLRIELDHGLLHYDLYRRLDGSAGYAAIGTGLGGETGLSSAEEEMSGFPKVLGAWKGMAFGFEATASGVAPTGDQNFSVQTMWRTPVDFLSVVSEMKVGGIYETQTPSGGYQYTLRNQTTAVGVEVVRRSYPASFLALQPFARVTANYERGALKPFITAHSVTLASIGQLRGEAEIGTRVFPFSTSDSEMMHGLGVSLQGTLPLVELFRRLGAAARTNGFELSDVKAELDHAVAPRLNIQVSVVSYRR